MLFSFQDSVVGESEDFWTLSSSSEIDSEYFLKLTSSAEFPFVNLNDATSDTEVAWAGFDASRLVIAAVDQGKQAYCKKLLRKKRNVKKQAVLEKKLLE